MALVGALKEAKEVANTKHGLVNSSLMFDVKRLWFPISYLILSLRHIVMPLFLVILSLGGCYWLSGDIHGCQQWNG
jgi:hypothetical protein